MFRRRASTERLRAEGFVLDHAGPPDDLHASPRPAVRRLVVDADAASGWVGLPSGTLAISTASDPVAYNPDDADCMERFVLSALGTHAEVHAGDEPLGA